MRSPKLFSRWRIVLSSMVLAAFAIACQSGGGGGGAQPIVTPAAPYPGCVGCAAVAGAAPLLNNIHSMTPDGLILFTLSLQGQVMQPCYQPGNKSVICAKGPVLVTGSMRVTQPNLYCGAAVGDYTINPLQLSTINLSTLTGGQYQAVGPAGVTIIFRLSTGILYNSTGTGLDISSPDNRIGMGLYIDSVNGSPCGIMSTN